MSNYADITHPLNCLMCKSEPSVWTPECQSSFDMLPLQLANMPIAQLPNPNKPYLFFTDVSIRFVTQTYLLKHL